MTSCCISLVDPPPPGFACLPPVKKLLLAAPVAIFARSLDEVLPTVPRFVERVHGLIVTPAAQTRWAQLGPLLWHLSLCEAEMPCLPTLVEGCLSLVSTAAAVQEKADVLARKDSHSQHDLDITRRDYLRITGELLQRVSELSEAQRALSRSNEELEERVRARTAELQAANVRLTELDRLKSQFLSNMSHELRTPLNAILGFAGVLLMRLSGPLNEEQDSQLKTIRDSSQHLLSLINDLLDMAKIEAGKMELRSEPVVCQQLMAEVMTTLQPLAVRKGLTLSVEAPDAAIQMFSDSRAIRQILLNLVGNAIKFTDRGGVTIVLRRPQCKDGAIVELTVHDTGVGIEPEHRQRIFQIFAQAESGVRDGTGLGLHLSQQYAQLLGGRIEFESETGRGSRFTLKLPLSTADLGRLIV